MNSGSGSERLSKGGSLCLLPCVVAMFAGVSVLMSACRHEEPLERAEIRATGRPTMTTRNVMTIISDSGVPQYKLVCPLWLVYDNVDTPVWILPGGPYLEKFDAQMKTVFTVACDSAVNNRRTMQWELYGNVEFKENPRLLILTQQLTWDQDRHMVYSDSFIHIEQPDKVIEGYGFEGYTSPSGRLTSYILHRPTAVLPYDQSKIDGRGAAAQGGVPNMTFDPTMMTPSGN